MPTLVLVLIAVIAVIHLLGSCAAALLSFAINAEYRIIDWKVIAVIILWEPAVVVAMIFLPPIIYQATKESIKVRAQYEAGAKLSAAAEEEKES